MQLRIDLGLIKLSNSSKRAVHSGPLLQKAQDSYEKSLSSIDSLDGSVTYSALLLSVSCVACVVVEQQRRQKLRCDAFTNIGNVCDAREEYCAALDFHQRALELARDLNDSEKLSRAYSNIGVTYNNLRDYERAEQVGSPSILGLAGIPLMRLT